MMTNLLGIIESSRLQQNAAYPTSWQDMFSFDTTGASSNWQNYSIRNFINRGLLPAEATKFKVTIKSHTGAKIKYSKCYLGKSDQYNFTETPVQITFGGNPVVQLESGQSIESDEIPLNYYGKGEIAFSAYCPADAATGGYNMVSSVSANNYMYATYDWGDRTTDLSVSGVLNIGGYSLVKVTAFVGGQWKEVFKYIGSYLSNGWNNYTIRTRINTSRLILSKSKFRIVMQANCSKVFIGNAVDGADLCDFRAAPTQVTFGGLNNTPATFGKGFVSDDIPLSVIDPTKPLLVSHLQNSNYTTFAIGPTGTVCKYKYGDFANSMATYGGSTYSGGIMNPLAIDEFI